MKPVRNLVEIGSEFWKEGVSSSHNQNTRFALSGRTAIDLVLQDMMASGLCTRTVYMPAWCCESMMQPFIGRGVKIELYDIAFGGNGLQYAIDTAKETDILYVANYFGYGNTLPETVIHLFKERGATILYDRTHSLFRMEEECQPWADYSIASIRKWLGVACGAVISKREGGLLLPEMRDCDYVAAKWEAMALKADYIREPSECVKEVYLKEFEVFDHALSQDYRNYRMDDESLSIWLTKDKDNLRNRRRNNSLFVETEIRQIPELQPMFLLKNNDCPLCVPVLLPSKEGRDALRKHLIENSIYCPVHWPKPNNVPNNFSVNDIYNRELSLLCDQRYTPDDLKRMTDTIKEYFNK